MTRNERELTATGDDARARQPLSGEAGRRVLVYLGIDPDFLPTGQVCAYEAFLPIAAQRGYYAALAEARARRPGAWTRQTELEWLASSLRVARQQRIGWWEQVWSQAVALAGHGARNVSELSARGRKMFVRALAERPAYPSLVVDALAEAIRCERASGATY